MLKRHQVACANKRERAIKQGDIKKEKTKAAENFLAGIQTVVATVDMATIWHGYFRTDCWADDKSQEDVLDNFELINDFMCNCGVHKQCAHRHAHFLGLSTRKRFDRILPGNFTANNAYTMKRLHGGGDSISERIERMKHFIHASAYIQTERGWHVKEGHRNPDTFATLEDNKRFLANLYNQWAWAQVTFMRDIQKKIDKHHKVLDYADLGEERRLEVEDKCMKLDERLSALEKTWGEEHTYSDDDLERDFDVFLDACRNKYLTIKY